MNVFYCEDAGDCSAELVARLLEARPEISGSIVRVVGPGEDYLNLSDLLVTSCRSRGLLSRKLLLPSPDLDVVCRLLLQSANRELTGSSSHTRSELFQLKDRIEKRRRRGLWPEDSRDGTVELAASKYQGFLKKCNLFDIWTAAEEWRRTLEALSSQLWVVLLLGPVSRVDLDVLFILDPEGGVTKLVLDDQTIQLSESLPISTLKEVSGSREYTMSSLIASECPGVQSWIGLMRLLVNTRDEISLARVLTQTGLLSAAQCQVVRQETDKSSLAMYQYIVSHVTQASLRGTSREDHPFMEFEKNILELVNLMERLHTRLEETSAAAEAVEKITSSVKTWFQKIGLKTLGDVSEVWRSVEAKIVKRQESIDSTPARGLIGRPAVKLLTGLVDLFSSESEPESKEEKNLTPARNKKLVNFFRTPLAQAPVVSGSSAESDSFDLMAQEAGLAERLGCAPLPPDEPVVYTRYKSCAAWAMDSSPVCLSAGRVGVRVGGSTLVAPATPDTPLRPVESIKEILFEVKENQERERRDESEKVGEKIKVKSRKRILALEVEEVVQKKFGLETKAVKVEKKPKGKKKIATPKGQRKLTSFFTR